MVLPEIMVSAEEHLLALHRAVVLPEVMVLAEEHLLILYGAVCCSAKVTYFSNVLFDMTNLVEYIISLILLSGFVVHFARTIQKGSIIF